MGKVLEARILTFGSPLERVCLSGGDAEGKRLQLVLPFGCNPQAPEKSRAQTPSQRQKELEGTPVRSTRQPGSWTLGQSSAPHLTRQKGEG